MAEVDIDIDKLTVPELLSAGSHLAEGLKDNEHFPAPTPPIAELTSIVDELAAAQVEYRKQRLLLDELKTSRDVIVKKLKDAVAAEVAYVQEASGGDAKKILSANLHIEHGISLWPFGGLDQVAELSASAGDEPGEVDLAWDPVRGADGYEVEVSRELTPHDAWEAVASTTKSRVTVAQLESRHRHWFRVRAVTEDSTGDWSDPVTKFAP
jgi:hypothetical protein